ncbi:hypothetical protein GUJ93_ZPchr0011g27936 [Zizania palustris]|uniref:Uncharacterized protein n=1 Tax=Zizania palustris TaxID=103762 RepID=A0A8J5WH64_ZIZPA|nr:hypothetical protein GUJ93_ZPchr0011g27936 [Zizania palustris]
MAAPSESFLHPDREIVSVICCYPVRRETGRRRRQCRYQTSPPSGGTRLHLRSPESETDDEDGAGAGAMAHIEKIKKRETIRRQS